MLHIHTADRVDGLASQLAEVLAEPLVDPMAAETIVIPSAGMERWLRLELARHLGAAPGRHDGVAANLDLIYPGTLSAELLHPHTDDEVDPWQLDRMVWVVLQVLIDGVGDAELGSITDLPAGATWWGRARRVADLFDRYLTHRPHMMLDWTQGNDADAHGTPLGPDLRWQPRLWRRVRARIGVPSTAEVRPTRLEALRAGDRTDSLGSRLSLFGLSTVPGGQPFLELLAATAAGRDVHVYLLQPSPVMAHNLRSVAAGAVAAGRARDIDPTSEAAQHPLLRSWAQPAREAAMLLDVLADGRDRIDDATILTTETETGSLLSRLQADLRADRAPTSIAAPTVNDTSIVVHSCHGASRQVEVLRDQLLHLLRADPTLTEDDIVVLCPALDTFAPLIAGGWGPSAATGTDRAVPSSRHGGPPALAYRITDRSLTETSSLFGALGALVELLSSRFSSTAVLDFIALAPVRLRFGFTDAAIATIAEWTERATIRWGLNGPHRSKWGLPPSFGQGSWRAGLDQILLGVAVTDDDRSLAAGGVAPIDVEGSDVVIAGRFADLLDRLEILDRASRTPRRAVDWTELLQSAADELFAVDDQATWQRTRLSSTLSRVADNSRLDHEACAVELTLADIRRLLSEQLTGAPSRAAFFKGGITVSSLTPLRNVPFRVVCLLGMDESAFTASSLDGDDLMARDPLLGDRDRRADVRQALLEAVLTARDHLVITRTGHSVVTNQPVPRAVPVAELTDVLNAMLPTPGPVDHVTDTGHTTAPFEVVHPRQGFDRRNFLAGELWGSAVWSFDPVACDAAAATRPLAVPSGTVVRVHEARDTPTSARAEFIDLADLHSFLAHPIRYHVTRVLRATLPRAPQRAVGTLVQPATGTSGMPRAADGPNLVVELDSLEKWSLKDRMLAERLISDDLDVFQQRQVAVGGLPAGRRATTALNEASEAVDPLVGAAASLGVRGVAAENVYVEVTLPDGTRVTGSVPDMGGTRPGPVTITPSKAPLSAAKHLPHWLNILVLTAHDPETPWWSVLIAATDPKRKTRFKIEKLEVAGPGTDERRQQAFDALGVIVDCFHRSALEPVPILPRVSPLLARGAPVTPGWAPHVGSGDRDDPYIALAFGHASLQELLAIDVRPDDPPGDEPKRLERYARYLWGAYDTSVVTT